MKGEAPDPAARLAKAAPGTGEERRRQKAGMTVWHQNGFGFLVPQPAGEAHPTGRPGGAKILYRLIDRMGVVFPDRRPGPFSHHRDAVPRLGQGPRQRGGQDHVPQVIIAQNYYEHKEPGDSAS